MVDETLHQLEIASDQLSRHEKIRLGLVDPMIHSTEHERTRLGLSDPAAGRLAANKKRLEEQRKAEEAARASAKKLNDATNVELEKRVIAGMDYGKAIARGLDYALAKEREFTTVANANAEYIATLSDMQMGRDPWQIAGDRTATDKQIEAAKDLEDSYLKTFENITAATESLADRMSNAFTDFVMTGKFSFKDFANSIIADLIRIQTRTMLTSLFANIVGGFNFGPDTGGGYGTTLMGGQTAGFKAEGGSVQAGRPYWVGERGKPELFVPKQNGDILPMADGAPTDSGNTYNVFNIQALDAPSVVELIRQSGAVPLLASENLGDNGVLRQAMLENM
jgi:lambda family phage tail tape measure protein